MGTGYTRGSGRVINNGTDINLPLRAEQFVSDTGEVLIKTLFERSFPFPYFPCLPPSSFSFYLYFHIFSRPRLRNLWERLSSLADPGRDI